ncbi:MAG: hypothetical protein QM805_26480 [Pseudomonas sp.]
MAPLHDLLARYREQLVALVAGGRRDSVNFTMSMPASNWLTGSVVCAAMRDGQLASLQLRQRQAA